MAQAISFEVRQPEVTDAGAISQLFLDRYDEILPGTQSWKPARKRFLAKHGEGFFVDKISRAELFPTENFGCVAYVGDELAGFTYASSDQPNLARLVGLVISRAYEGHGVGTRLEIERQGWADVNEKVLYGQIVDENERARSFYRYNGYRELGTRVMAETVFRLIEHTPPQMPLLSTEVHWSETLGNEPIVY